MNSIGSSISNNIRIGNSSETLTNNYYQSKNDSSDELNIIERRNVSNKCTMSHMAKEAK